MANLVQNPYEIITNADGDPLEDGYVFVGEPGLSPVTNPLQAYWDSDLSVPAVNVRTKGGYLSRSGSPGRLYTATNYSILVQDKNQRTLYTNLNAVDYFNAPSGALISSVETIADLRGIIPTEPNTQISVGGSVTAGDGLMAPLYYWAALSSATDNGVSIIEPTSSTGAGRWLWINTNAPMENVNIDSSVTLDLAFINRIFLVDTALAIVLAVPDGDFQGQDIQIANRGVDTLEITGTGIPADTFITESALLTWLGTQWSITFKGSFAVSTISVDTIEELTPGAGVTFGHIVNWRNHYKGDAVTTGDVYTALSTWVPVVGDLIAAHGQIKTASGIGAITSIQRTSSTVIVAVRVLSDVATPTLLPTTFTESGAVAIEHVELMTNFDVIN